MSNTPSILVTGASRGIGKATARDRSSYLTGSGRLQARGRSRPLVKAVMALITLTAMEAVMFAVPATSHAVPASTKLVWIRRVWVSAYPVITHRRSTAGRHRRAAPGKLGAEPDLFEVGGHLGVVGCQERETGRTKDVLGREVTE